MESRSETHRDGKNIHQTTTIIHEGKEFTAGSGGVIGDAAIGYVKKLDTGELVLTLGDGKVIGTRGVIRKTWKTPRSWTSSTMSQVEFTIDTRRFTGRGAGVGMLWRGKEQAPKGGKR